MDKLEIFKGADGQYYWRRVAPNAQVVAVGGEGFTRKEDAIKAARRGTESLPDDVQVDELT